MYGLPGNTPSFLDDHKSQEYGDFGLILLLLKKGFLVLDESKAFDLKETIRLMFEESYLMREILDDMLIDQEIARLTQ